MTACEMSGGGGAYECGCMRRSTLGGLCCPAASSPLCANLILCLPPVMHSTAFVKHTHTHTHMPLAPSLSSHHLYINYYYSASTPFPLLLLVNGDQVTGAPRSRAQHYFFPSSHRSRSHHSTPSPPLSPCTHSRH
jgi:hypothetical protein